MGGKFHPNHAHDIFTLLAEAASHRDRRAAGDTDTTNYRPPPDNERLTAIADFMVIKEVQVGFHLTVCVHAYEIMLFQVPSQDDMETCGLHVILNACAAMDIGPLNDLVCRHGPYLIVSDRIR